MWLSANFTSMNLTMSLIEKKNLSAGPDFILPVWARILNVHARAIPFKNKRTVGQ